MRWNFVYQRPQHLLSRAARDVDVLYVEEPELVQGGAPRLREERHGGVLRLVPEIPEGEPVLPALRALTEALLREQRGRLAAWFYTPLALRFVDPAAFDVVAYDCMDELSGFAGADPEMAAMEQRLLAVADVVFTGGRSLYESKRAKHPNVRAEPSSVDASHFGAARAWTGRRPADLAGLKRPILGWFGVIDERMDLELVAGVADLRPDWTLAMVGPVAKIDPASLPQRANIQWLGCKDYTELPAYLAGWDCGIMPFALNAATRFISPTKTPEYLAAGVPVVSTPVRDVVSPWGDAGLVEIADAPEAFAHAAEAAMARPRAPWLNDVDAALAHLSWDRTWARMRDALNAAKRSALAPAPASAP